MINNFLKRKKYFSSQSIFSILINFHMIFKYPYKGAWNTHKKWKKINEFLGNHLVYFTLFQNSYRFTES